MAVADWRTKQNKPKQNKIDCPCHLIYRLGPPASSAGFFTSQKHNKLLTFQVSCTKSVTRGMDSLRNYNIKMNRVQLEGVIGIKSKGTRPRVSGSL